MKGGAARAALRLYEALCCVGADVRYLTVYQDNPDWKRKIRYFLRVLKDRLPAILRSRRKIYFSSGGFNNPTFIEAVNASEADIVHLHWINAGALSYSDISRINKPIVWSLHDMWLFTGGCHYDGNCEAFKKGCGSCPQLGSKGKNDLSKRNYEAKHKMVMGITNLTVVGLSRWIATSAKSSAMMKEIKVVNLPNPIDTSVFFPESKIASRAKFGLRDSKQVILFGAMSGADDPRKGYSQLIHALKSLNDIDNFQLATFGGDMNGLPSLGIEVKSLGKVSDDATLRALYSAADVVVVPSLQENLSNIIMESLACGTPVVGFNIGGNSDLIQHKLNGYLADANNAKSLAEGIEWVLSGGEARNLSDNARNFAVSNFNYETVGAKYLKLYEDILKNQIQ